MREGTAGVRLAEQILLEEDIGDPACELVGPRAGGVAEDDDLGSRRATGRTRALGFPNEIGRSREIRVTKPLLQSNTNRNESSP